MSAVEVNFDALVGPTHHYGGLAPGNLASMRNQGRVSRPRQAALEGLAKMTLLADLGIPQAVLPPQPRPCWEFLQRQGWTGTPAEIIQQAAMQRPDLLSIAYSSAAMWAANAATVSPSADTEDGRVHLTPANLISTPHRQLESNTTTALLRKIFADHRHFVVGDPLPPDSLLADEGAANHMRLCESHGAAGLELFVYGRDPAEPATLAPAHLPARQTRQACERIAALHDLPAERRMIIQQLPAAVDAGVFHNDVIAVANENVLLCHERAFVNQPQVLQSMRSRYKGQLFLIEIAEQEFSLAEAVETYLFNSQLITLPESDPAGHPQMLLLCPAECEQHPRARAVLERILAEENPVRKIRYVDVRQSMRNGGGPACLRLRVVLNAEELAQVRGNLFLNQTLTSALEAWIRQHYREELRAEDLADPQLALEVQTALDELQNLLQL